MQCGPIIYCVEGKDNNGKAWNFIVPREPVFEVSVFYEMDLLGGVNTISFNAMVMTPADNGKTVSMESESIKAIPYFSWNNRGAGEMQVWLPTAIKELMVNPDN